MRDTAQGTIGISNINCGSGIDLRRTFRRYYDNAYIEKTLDLDDNFIKEYFPVDVVVPAILEIYQELLGVKFRDVTGKTSAWHPGDFAFLCCSLCPCTDLTDHIFVASPHRGSAL